MRDLSMSKCKACEGWMKPMEKAEIEKYLPQVNGWVVVDGKNIEKDFKFNNFKEALLFVNKVGELAESEGHHPDISMHNWNRVRITLTTHALKGLSENDFIMAAKIESLSP